MELAGKSSQIEIKGIHKKSDERDWIYDDYHKNSDELYQIG